MKVKFGSRSKKNLCDNLDFRLVHIICEVARNYDFTYDWGVFETKRTLEKQKRYVKEGVSKTLNSKHIPNASGIVNAFDLVPCIDGKYTWEGKQANKCFEELHRAVKETAEKLYPGILTYGYDWGWDKPHHEIKSVFQI